MPRRQGPANCEKRGCGNAWRPFHPARGRVLPVAESAAIPGRVRTKTMRPCPRGRAAGKRDLGPILANGLRRQAWRRRLRTTIPASPVARIPMAAHSPGSGTVATERLALVVAESFQFENV